MAAGAMEQDIERIIVTEAVALNRPDLFRKPLVGFSAAGDGRYTQLKEIVGKWLLTPTELLPGARSIVSYFVPFTKPTVAEPKTVKNGSPLWGESYAAVNSCFDRINEAVANYLEQAGFSVKTIRATHTYDPKDMQSLWSHRSAAAIAGLGSFGANRMLITEKGSGGRFCSVITSAPLKAHQGAVRDRCLYVKNGSCGKCFKVCPVQALAPGSLNKFSCQDELNKNDREQREVTGYMADTCGKCISVCPLAYIE